MAEVKEYEFRRNVQAVQFKGDKNSIKEILALTAPSDIAGQYQESPREVIILRVLGETLKVVEGDWVIAWKSRQQPFNRYYDVVPEELFTFEYRELPRSEYSDRRPF